MADCKPKFSKEAVIANHFEAAQEVARRYYRRERNRTCKKMELEELESEAFLALPEIVKEWDQSQPFDEYFPRELRKRLRSAVSKQTEYRRKHQQLSELDETQHEANVECPESNLELSDFIESKLTPEEQGVARLMGEGITEKTELAELLGMNRNTVAIKIAGIREKLQPFESHLG